MTDEEINRTIAEFMDWSERSIELISKGDFHLVDWQDPFTESLDALVPVVEKINLNFQLNRFKNKDYRAILFSNNGEKYSYDESPSRALALAICEVINGQA